MFTNKEIKNKIEEITQSVLDEVIVFKNIEDEKRALFLIINNSVSAVNFIALIEDEFGIELDDDEISIELFESFKNIKEMITKHKTI